MLERCRWFGIRTGAIDGEEGAALVEFAVSTPILVTMVLGIIGFAMEVFSYNCISTAAHEGTRYAQVHGADCPSCNLSSSQIASYITGIASEGMNTNALTVNVYCGPSGSSPPTGDCGQSTSGTPNDNPGNVVYVQVKYTYTFFSTLIPIKPISIQSVSERVIWQ